MTTHEIVKLECLKCGEPQPLGDRFDHSIRECQDCGSTMLDAVLRELKGSQMTLELKA